MSFRASAEMHKGYLDGVLYQDYKEELKLEEDKISVSKEKYARRGKNP